MARPPAPDGLARVEAFCNTAVLLHATDELATVAGARAWASRDAGRGAAPRLDEPVRAALVEVREAVRGFLADRTDPAVRAALNGHVAALLGPPQVGGDGRLALAPPGSLRGTTADVVAALVGPALAELLRDGLDGRGARLKVCANPGCRWVFYDRAPAANGVWCDMNVCGARHKMRTYRSAAAAGVAS
ncbi:CGNR zinc finger domain-containing protein [Oerskovia flava]|uniref:CGNR zinc finger domain-containing protein n=1 Tax=Oerskovia flava TaxID=2986422 RepID=UPI002240000A|nr:CGNR zinc finger domain-containing protein [Oerskovia sp. JB1-3-2]